MKSAFLFVVAVLGAVVWCAPAHAQITPEAARALLAKSEASVISVKIVAKTTMAMQGRESSKQDQEIEATGCVVDPSGLTVVSLGMTDPSSMYQDMMGGSSGSDSSNFKVSSEITDIKLHFADGTEVSGEVAIRDKDLDIAIIKPKLPLAAPVPAVSLGTSGDAKVLDPILVISRLGKMGNWTTVASIRSINGILTKPRMMYLLTSVSSEFEKEFGSLALTTDGKVLGIQMIRKVPASGQGSPEMFSVILPAQDILGVVKQIPK